MKNEDKRKTTLGELTERLYDPLQFRIFVTGIVLTLGYVCVYMPLDDHIAATNRNVKKTKEFERLAQDIEGLSAELGRISTRLPKNTDTNEWVEYILSGVRELPVTLVKFGSEDPRRVGPFQAVVLELDLRGDYEGLESFLHWIETNERLFRIDSIALTPARGSNQLNMNVKLLGLRG